MEGRCLRSLGAATATHPQGPRTPDWPTQPTTKPRDPCARTPSGPYHTGQIAQWKEEKKKQGDREGTQRTTKLLKFNP